MKLSSYSTENTLQVSFMTWFLRGCVVLIMNILIILAGAYSIAQVEAFNLNDNSYPYPQEEFEPKDYTDIKDTNHNVNIYVNFYTTYLANHNADTASNTRETSFIPNKNNENTTLKDNDSKIIHSVNINVTQVVHNESFADKPIDTTLNNKTDDFYRFLHNGNNVEHNTTIREINVTKIEENDVKKSNNIHIALSLDEVVNKQLCTEKYERFALSGSCDQYIECKNSTAEIVKCPDGLHYNPKAKLDVSPCQNSFDVPCPEGFTTQSAQWTRDCPHQFGFYKLEDAYNCSSYRICEFGIGYDYKCPDGLAFRSDTFRCDWPHNVPECDAEGYAGFTCPKKTDDVAMYRSPKNCQVYFICTNNIPRRMNCDEFLGYDSSTNTCEPADKVIWCPGDLQDSAVQDRKNKLVNSRRRNPDETEEKIIDNYLQYRFRDISFLRYVKESPRIISYDPEE